MNDIKKVGLMINRGKDDFIEHNQEKTKTPRLIAFSTIDVGWLKLNTY
ncbi:MAG: hypothetical protein ACP5PZ_07950 [Bacteroidales bacterium]